jgi:hypothetical protein
MAASCEALFLDVKQQEGKTGPILPGKMCRSEDTRSVECKQSKRNGQKECYEREGNRGRMGSLDVIVQNISLALSQ